MLQCVLCVVALISGGIYTFNDSQVSMLQCVAVCCSESQYVAMSCSVFCVLQVWFIEESIPLATLMFAVCCNVLQCVAVCCSVSQVSIALIYGGIYTFSDSQVSMLQYVAVC